MIRCPPHLFSHTRRPLHRAASHQDRRKRKPSWSCHRMHHDMLLRHEALRHPVRAIVGQAMTRPRLHRPGCNLFQICKGRLRPRSLLFRRLRCGANRQVRRSRQKRTAHPINAHRVIESRRKTRKRQRGQIVSLGTSNRIPGQGRAPGPVRGKVAESLCASNRSFFASDTKPSVNSPCWLLPAARASAARPHLHPGASPLPMHG